MVEHVWRQEVDLGPLRRGEAAEVLLRYRRPLGWGLARVWPNHVGSGVCSRSWVAAQEASRARAWAVGEFGSAA
jgi:hypothetical protein